MNALKLVGELVQVICMFLIAVGMAKWLSPTPELSTPIFIVIAIGLTRLSAWGNQKWNERKRRR